jgi:WD40 repeat protein
VRSVAFSPDGRLLVSGSNDHTIRLWEVSTGQCLKVLQKKEMALTYPVAFCPDGHMIAHASNDHTIQLWNINEERLIRPLQGHSGNVTSLAFSADGSLLLSASEDETMKLWNVATGTCLLTLRIERPYEHMDITGITGVTRMQEETIGALGASAKNEDSGSS